MADSIAKLAVIITGDASPLGDATRQAQKYVRDMENAWTAGLARIKAATDSWAAGMRNLAGSANPFSAFAKLGEGPGGGQGGGWLAGMAKLKEQQDRWAAGMSRLADSTRATAGPFDALVTRVRQYNTVADQGAGFTFKMATALSAARGNLGAISNIALAGGGLTAAVAGVAALSVGLYKLAAASDALEVAAGGNKLDTWAGQFDRVEESALSIAQSLGRPFSEVLTRETKQLADIMALIAETIMPEQIRQERERVKLLEEAKVKEKERADAAKRAADEAAAAAREVQARMDEQFRRAQSIQQSLRTPAEVFRDTVAELNRLFEVGVLNVGTLERGLSKARADLVDASKIASEIKTPSASAAISAAERFTASGQAAVEAAKRETQRLADVAKAQLESDKRREDLIKETNRLLKLKGISGPTLAIAGLQ